MVHRHRTRSRETTVPDRVSKTEMNVFRPAYTERISTHTCHWLPFVLHAGACTSGETDGDARQSGYPACSAVPASPPPPPPPSVGRSFDRIDDHRVANRPSWLTIRLTLVRWFFYSRSLIILLSFSPRENRRKSIDIHMYAYINTRIKSFSRVFVQIVSCKLYIEYSKNLFIFIGHWRWENQFDRFRVEEIIETWLLVIGERF